MLQSVESYYDRSNCGLVGVTPLQGGSAVLTQPTSVNSFDPDQIFTIPVNAYLLLDEEGGFDEVLEGILEYNQQDIYSLLLLRIEEWNDLVPRLQLELCSFHSVFAIESARTSGYAPWTHKWVRRNYPELMTEDPNESLQIFIGDGSQNWGNSPDGVFISPFQTVFFHEVGHYFGLYHTDYGTFARDTEDCPDRILLYPDNSLVENCIPGDNSNGLSVEECGDMDLGFCSGDLVADTPVDIGGMDNICPSIVTRDINGQEYDYTPSWTNILRANGSSILSTQMTDGQKNRMLGVFLGELPPIGHPEGPNSPFQPDFSILRENSIVANECNDHSEVSPVFLYGWSNINLVKVVENEVALQPIFRGRLSYESINTNPPIFSDVQNVSSYILDGRVKRPLVEVDRGGSIQFEFDDFELGCSEEGLFFEENLNINDVIALLRHVTGEFPLESPYLKIAADLNNSGTIRTSDIVSLIQRILGVSENFDVPDFRMVPELAFVSDEMFSTAFEIDPFTASWNFQDKQYNYLQDEEYSSYLGDRIDETGLPNLKGFKHQFPSEYTQISEAVSFKVVESGNIYQEDDGAEVGRTVNLAIDDQSSYNSKERSVKISFSLSSGQRVKAFLAKFNVGRHNNEIEEGRIIFSRIYPEIVAPELMDHAMVNEVNNPSEGKLRCFYSGEKGVFSYSNGKTESTASEFLFYVVADIKGKVKEEDILTLLGEIDFSSVGVNLLNLEVQIEDFDAKQTVATLDEPVCTVYNPVRSDIFSLEILAKKKASMNLTVCDFSGNCNSYQIETNVTVKPERFERTLVGLEKGIGYYWITDGNYLKSGIAVIE